MRLKFYLLLCCAEKAGSVPFVFFLLSPTLLFPLSFPFLFVYYLYFCLYFILWIILFFLKKGLFSIHFITHLPARKKSYWAKSCLLMISDRPIFSNTWLGFKILSKRKVEQVRDSVYLAATAEMLVRLQIQLPDERGVPREDFPFFHSLIYFCDMRKNITSLLGHLRLASVYLSRKMVMR